MTAPRSGSAEGRAGSPSRRTRAVRDQARGGGPGEAELVGEKPVEALGAGDRDGEPRRRRQRHGRYALDGGAAPGDGARAVSPAPFLPSPHSESASAKAPQVTAMSATLNVGQRRAPTPTSRKSTTPRAERTRSIRLPSAPAQIAASA